MLKQAPSVIEIGSALQNKEVTQSKPNVSPMVSQMKPQVDILQFREAYNKATSDGYKGKKSDFALQLEKEGVQVEGFDKYKEEMVKNEVVKGKRKSYFGMVADVVDTRYQNTKKQFARTGKSLEKIDNAVGAVDTMKAYQEQQFSGLTSVVTPVAEAVGGIVDIALNTLGRGIRTITPDSVEKYVTKQGKEIWDVVKEKEFVKDALGYLATSAEEYNNWAMNNPDEAQMMSNVMNIADVALIGGGSKVAKEAVEGAGKKGMRMATVDEAKQMVQKKLKTVSDYVKTPKLGEAQDSLIDTFASKVGGLRQETIQTIRTNPLYEVAEKGELTRVGFGQEVLNAVEARREEISELGSLYNNFRNPEIIVDLRPVRQNVKTNILDKYKIKITNGGLDFRNSKFANDVADQNAIKNALDLLTEDTLTADVALNRRQAISKMARFGSDVSGDGASVVREIRHQFNEQMHKDIKGLKAIDNQIAPEIQQIDSLVKDYYNKDGTLKDSFYSTITNITNKGKELKYDRLNKIMPDIDSRVSALKALEDVENALNQKTGIYEKIAYYGSLFGVGTSVGGPIGGGAALMFGAKYADPRNIVQMLKKRGGSAIVVADKLEANKALSAFDNEIIEKALRESGEQAQDIATRGERRLPFLVDDSTEDVVQQADNIVPQATEVVDNVTTPPAGLDEMLRNASEEELKAMGFTPTMIKRVKSFKTVGTTESATQSIAGKADEVLQTPTPISKVDDALPVGEKMDYIPGQDISDFNYNKYKSTVLKEFPKLTEKDIKRMYQTLIDEGTIKPQTTPTTTQAVGKPKAQPLDKIDESLLSEARKYDSAEEFLDAISKNLANKDIMTFNEFKKTKPNTTLEMYNKIKKEMPFMLEKDGEFMKGITQTALDKMIPVKEGQGRHYQVRKIREQSQK